MGPMLDDDWEMLRPDEGPIDPSPRPTVDPPPTPDSDPVLEDSAYKVDVSWLSSLDVVDAA